MTACYEALVLLFEGVAFIFDPEENEISQKSEDYDEAHVFVALYLDYLVGESLPPKF